MLRFQQVVDLPLLRRSSHCVLAFTRCVITSLNYIMMNNVIIRYVLFVDAWGQQTRPTLVLERLPVEHLVVSECFIQLKF